MSTVYAINANTFGVSTYVGWDIQALCEHEGAAYAVGDTDLFELAGDDDDGTAIAAYVKTGELDFGSVQFKRIPRDYVSLDADGDILLKVNVERRGEAVTKSKTVGVRVSGVIRDEPVKLFRGLSSVHFQREMHNVSGSDFDMKGWVSGVEGLDRRK